MNRNKIQQNINFFQMVCNCIRHNESYSISACKRFIQTNDEEKEWLIRAEITAYTKLSRESFAIAVLYNEDEYLFLVGISLDESFESSDFDPLEMNAGVATILGGEELLRVSANIADSEIVDKILYDTTTIPYCGHQWDDIKSLFPKVIGYKLKFTDNAITLKDRKNYYWIVLSLLVSTKAVTHNGYTADTFVAWEKVIFEKHSEKVSYRGLLMAYSALNWETTYLHLYQCMEDVFFYQTILEIYNSLGIDKEFEVFYSKLIDELQWKPHAEKAIGILLKKLGKTHPGYALLKKHTNNEDLAKWIYKMRNKIVHESSEALIRSDENSIWDEIIRGILYLLSSI